MVGHLVKMTVRTVHLDHLRTSIRQSVHAGKVIGERLKGLDTRYGGHASHESDSKDEPLPLAADSKFGLRPSSPIYSRLVICLALLRAPEPRASIKKNKD